MSLEERIAELESRQKELLNEVQTLRRRVMPSAPRIPKFCSVGADTNIDPSVVLWAGSENRAIKIGSNCTIRRGGEWIGPITVGNRVVFNRDSYIRSNVVIGDRVNIGPFVRLVTGTHEMGSGYRRAGKSIFLPIVIGNGVWIGASVTIVGNVKVGDGAVIAAGAIVTKDIPANCVAGGVPAKVIRQLEP